jgi:NAD-reducing hydrogenase small subunit
MTATAESAKVKLATVWLDGCSGCHMSFLDMDERLLELSSQFDLVFSPIVDFKVYPEAVDVALVEGAISSVEDEHKIHHIRKHTKFLIAMGDCAVTGNVPAMRNPFGPEPILKRAYNENVSTQPQIPCVIVPSLLDKVRPVHEFVKVDMYLPGCPPSAGTFYTVLSELLAGRTPDVASLTRFGA